jgi:hypothetical protein
MLAHVVIGHGPPTPTTWERASAQVRPGAHALVFATRPKEMALPLRAAGFEVRDTIMFEGGRSIAPIMLCRKPLAGTLARTAVDQGAGGINIDGTRVAGGPGYAEEVQRNVEAFAKLQARNPGWKNSSTYAPNVEGALKGRWPPNVLLSHGTTCVRRGTKRLPAPVINRFDDGMKPFGNGAGHAYTSTQTGDAEGMETVDVWDCLPGCPVREVNGAVLDAARFFPALGSEVPLLRWLIRLACPKGGLILDACGSDILREAAAAEGADVCSLEESA